MTPAQVRTAMIPLVRRLVNGGTAIASFDGVRDDVGQLTLRTPAGYFLSVELAINLPVLLPLDAFVATAQEVVRAALKPFAGDYGRGFKGRRGVLPVGSPGFSANDGWV